MACMISLFCALASDTIGALLYPEPVAPNIVGVKWVGKQLFCAQVLRTAVAVVVVVVPEVMLDQETMLRTGTGTTRTGIWQR
jgi:hypothetical protein